MNGHPRKAGVIETKPRAPKPPRPRHTLVIPLLHSQLEEKWIVFDHTVSCLGTMLASDYQKFVQSHATTDNRARILLKDIDYWDSWARWSTCLILLQWDEITLYDSREQAEAAMRRAG